MPAVSPLRNAELPELPSSRSVVPSAQRTAMAVWARVTDIPAPVPRKMISMGLICL